MTIPRTDPFRPPVEQAVATRGVRLEKLVEDQLQAQIDASIPVATLQPHKITAAVHEDLYGLTELGGLSVQTSAGRACLDVTVYNHNSTVHLLTASATNYIKVTAAGVVLSSTVAFSSGQIPLWIVTTDATGVTVTTDVRAVIARGGGGGGGGGGTLDTAYDFPTPGTGSGRIILTADGAVELQNLEADTNPNLDIVRAAADINAQPSAYLARVSGETLPRVGVFGNQLAFSVAGVSYTGFLRLIGTQVMGLHNTSVGNALEFLSMSKPSTPLGGYVRLYPRVFGTGLSTFLLDQLGRELGPLGEKAQATVFGKGPSGGMEPPLSGTWSDGLWGSLAPAASWTPTGAMSVANNTGAGRGRYMQAQAAAGVGLDAGVESLAQFWSNKGDAYLIRFELPSVSTIRMFVGVAAQTLATMVGADNPGANHMGIQFSTPRGDANWQFTERGSSATQVVTNTTVGVSTATFYLQLITGSLTQMVLLDSTLSPLATRSVGVTTKPGGSTALSIIVGIENQSAGATASIRWYQISQHARDG